MGHNRKLPTGKPIQQALTAFFKMQRRKILEVVKHHSQLLPMKALDPVETFAITFGLENLPSLFVPAEVWGKWRDMLAHACKPLVEIYFEEAARKFMARTGASPDVFSVVRPYLGAAAEKLTLDFCDATNRTTRLELSDALAQTREAVYQHQVVGDPMPVLTARVNEIFEDAETWRAKRIAVTESSRAIHQADLMGAVASGNVARIYWLASADACPICVAIVEANPNGVLPGQPFAVGIGKNPNYSTILTAPSHVGCQCSVTMQPTEDTAPGIRLGDLQALADHWGLQLPANAGSLILA